MAPDQAHACDNAFEWAVVPVDVPYRHDERRRRCKIEFFSGAGTEFEFGNSRQGFLQVVRGSVEIDGEELDAGDAVTVQDQAAFAVRALQGAELLFFDMAAG